MRSLQREQVSATPLPIFLSQGERVIRNAKASFRTPKHVLVKNGATICEQYFLKIYNLAP